MKTTSKRIILVWLFTILATVALTACSNKNGDKGGNNSSDKELTDESKNNKSCTYYRKSVNRSGQDSYGI